MNQQARIGLDASVVLAFALPDDTLHSQATTLFRKLVEQGTTFCAPAMLAYECDSVICLRVWKGEMSEKEAQLARAAIAALPITIEYDPRDRERAFEIARRYNQPRAYDAAYAAHAEARGVELVTTDKPLHEAVNGAKKPKGAPKLSWVKLLE